VAHKVYQGDGLWDHRICIAFTGFAFQQAVAKFAGERSTTHQRALPSAILDYDAKDASQVLQNYQVYGVKKLLVVAGPSSSTLVWTAWAKRAVPLRKEFTALLEDDVLEEVAIEKDPSVKRAA
jgi:hypothetical protein